MRELVINLLSIYSNYCHDSVSILIVQTVLPFAIALYTQYISSNQYHRSDSKQYEIN